MDQLTSNHTHLDCHGHGIVMGDKCNCYAWYFDEDCTYSFRAHVGLKSWNGLMISIAVVQALAAGTSLWALISQKCRVSTNFRHLGLFLNVCGCITRFIWAVDPGQSLSGVIINSVFLRLAQVFWIAALLCVVYIWMDVLAALGRTSVPTWKQVTMFGAVTLFGFIVIVVSFADALTPYPWREIDVFSIVSDSFFILFCGALTIVGIYFVISLARRLRRLQSLDMDANPVLLRVIRHVRRAIQGLLAFLILSLTLFLSVVITYGAGWFPDKNPKAFFVYMIVIHMGVEGIGPWLIFFHVQPPWQSSRFSETQDAAESAALMQQRTDISLEASNSSTSAQNANLLHSDSLGSYIIPISSRSALGLFEGEEIRYSNINVLDPVEEF